MLCLLCHHLHVLNHEIMGRLPQLSGSFLSCTLAQPTSDSYNESISTTVKEEETDLPPPALPFLNHYIEGLEVVIQAETRAQLLWEIPEPIISLVQDEYASYSATCFRKGTGRFLVQKPSSPVTLQPLGNYDSMHCTAKHLLQNYFFYTR